MGYVNIPLTLSLLRGVLHRGAVITILKSLVCLGPGWIRTRNLPHSERTLYHYATELKKLKYEQLIPFRITWKLFTRSLWKT